MPRTIIEAEARANITQFIAQAANGEEFIIARGNAPDVRLAPAFPITDLDAEKQKRREKAIETLKQWPKRIIGAPMTIEEIISARDEGRK